MELKRELGVLVVALSVVACGGSSSSDVCTNLGSAATGFVTKAQPCFGSSTPSLGFTQQQCSAALASCTESDKQKLQSFATCLNGLATCSTATQAAWAASAQTCVDVVETCNVSGCTSKLSAGCQ